MPRFVVIGGSVASEPKVGLRGSRDIIRVLTSHSLLWNASTASFSNSLRSGMEEMMSAMVVLSICLRVHLKALEQLLCE